MAFAFANAGKPAIDAAFAPECGPSIMQECRDWNRARSVDLCGFGGTSSQSTEVRALWNEDWLFFAFACSDRDIVCPGTMDGIDHFLLGDTVEVFVARRGVKAYAEIHATPAGWKTVYFFGDYRKPSDPPQDARNIYVAAEKTHGGWRAFVAVPRDLFGRKETEDEYDFFLGRYDYAVQGDKPTLSSFPAQRGDKPDFHRRADYAILRLKS